MFCRQGGQDFAEFPPVNKTSFVNSFPAFPQAQEKPGLCPGFPMRTGDYLTLRHHVISGRLFTTYPAQRNKTCVILLRSLAQNK